ncbi:MAG: LPXTG cell wall anchor domain-containing protein, partial [Acidimicrobiales bacterium]
LSLSSLGTSSLTGPLLNTAGTGTDTAQTHSQTFLQSNGDGTFGLSSQVYETIAPLSVNVLGLLQIQITVAGTSPSQPITLTANAPGGSSGASVTASNLGLLTVSIGTAGGTPTPLLSIPLSSVGTNGLHIPLSVAGLGNLTSSLTGALSGVASQIPAAGSTLSSLLSSLSGPLSSLAGSLGTTVSGVANLSLGSLDIDTTPHAIGQSATTPATLTGGTVAAGSLDLVHLDLGVAGSLLGLNIPGLNLANLFVGHMETAASLTSGPITCNLPIVKTSSAQNVAAGNSFSYTIQIPDPSKLALISCNLTNITATDTITDNQGTPTFQVTAANDGGTIAQSSPTTATITWTGLTYNVAPTGQPPNAPITLTINVTIPTSSPAGVIQDVVLASGTAAACNGGISGITNLGGANGVIFGGSFTLPAPSVTSATGITGPTTPNTLPKTGGTGGPWQPMLGLGTLLAGGGALGLARRSRRRSLLS